MKRKQNTFTLILMLLSFSCALFAINPQIEKVMDIGEEERDDYMFFHIVDADISPDGSIFVVDKKGAFVSKFDKNGKFVKRVGQRGRGPGDFFRPQELQIFNGKVFITDKMNDRIAYTDLDLKDDFEYYRTSLFSHDKYSFDGKIIFSFRVLEEDRLLFTFMSPTNTGINSFYFTNRKLKVDDNFFVYPPGSVIQTSLKSEFFVHDTVLYDVSIKHKKILVSHMVANNPITFHLYDFSGKLIKHFQRKLPEDIGSIYRFLKAKKNTKQRFNIFVVTSIHAYQDYFFVFIEQIRNVSKDMEDKNKICEPYALVFDTNGEYLAKMPMERTGVVFSISETGHVLMQTKREEGEDETTKLTIYKLML